MKWKAVLRDVVIIYLLTFWAGRRQMFGERAGHLIMQEFKE